MDVQAVLKQLQERAKSDAALREALETDPAGVLARETGLTRDAVRQQAEEVNDLELAAVAGGLGRGRQFSCPCGKQFATMEDLQRHQLHECMPSSGPIA